MGTSVLVCHMRAEDWFVPLDQNSVKWHTKEKVERPPKAGVPPMQLERWLSDLATWHQSDPVYFQEARSSSFSNSRRILRKELGCSFDCNIHECLDRF